jgi:phage terminase large subunit-like protein
VARAAQKKHTATKPKTKIGDRPQKVPPKRRGKPPLKSREELILSGTYKACRDPGAKRGPRRKAQTTIKPRKNVRPDDAVVKARKWARDYVAIADRYAKDAANPKNADVYCRWIRLAAQRYIDDRLRARQPSPPFYFDEWYASDPCDFIEKLPHVEGRWETETIVLHESHVFFLVNLFGFRLQDGTRRFTSALFAVARKNAKSTLAAAIGLYCETSEGEQGPQIVSAATTGSQARIIFNIAKRMAEKALWLKKEHDLKPFANGIAAMKCGGTFKPINSKASSQDGLNPSCVLLDEIHAHKTHDLVNVLRSAAGARVNPLFLFTTTEGYETPGPWPELRHLAKQILEGLIAADHFLVVYYAVDEAVGTQGEPGYVAPDDDFDESTWIKANPLMTVNPMLLTNIQKEALEARAMPGRLSEFRIKRLNRQASSAGAWINIPQWKMCSGEVDLKWLSKYPCWGGLDLASVKDFTSFRLVWQVDNIWYTHGWRFVPRAAVKHRSDRGLVPYQGWVSGGYLLVAGDEVTDYDVVEACILQAKKDFNLQKVAYDSWNAKQLAQKLIEKGVAMEEFIQGPKSYHPAMKTLERAYTEGKLRHGNDPVLNWCASNITARTDVNMNMAPDKKGAPEKIDDMVSLLMAIGVADRTPDKPKAPQLFFV